MDNTRLLVLGSGGSGWLHLVKGADTQHGRPTTVTSRPARRRRRVWWLLALRRVDPAAMPCC